MSKYIYLWNTSHSLIELVPLIPNQSYFFHFNLSITHKPLLFILLS